MEKVEIWPSTIKKLNGITKIKISLLLTLLVLGLAAGTAGTASAASVDLGIASNFAVLSAAPQIV